MVPEVPNKPNEDVIKESFTPLDRAVCEFINRHMVEQVEANGPYAEAIDPDTPEHEAFKDYVCVWVFGGSQIPMPRSET